jgi:hypothetical protein
MAGMRSVRFAQPVVGSLIIASAQEAQVELDEYECRIPSGEVADLAPKKSATKNVSFSTTQEGRNADERDTT